MSERTSFEVEFPYSARNGVNVVERLEEIQAPLSEEMSVERRAEIALFARGLFEGKAEGLDAGVPRDLEALHQSETKTFRQSFYLGYFSTERGQADLAALGLPVDADESTITETLSDVAGMTERLSAKARKQIAHRSVSWHKAMLAELLTQPPQVDATFEDFTEVEVNYNPDALLTKIEDLRKYRDFYNQLRRQLREAGTYDLTKRILLDVHIGRVNHILTEMYPVALSLARQLQQSPESDDVEAWSDRLAEVAPFISNIYNGDNAEDIEVQEQELARRFDYVRNGVVQEDKLTSLGSRMEAFLDEQSVGTQQDQEGLIEPSLLAELDAIEWNAGQLKTFLETVLQEWGLLSEEQADWSSVDDREGFAADGLYQVVVTPEKKNLMVVSAKRVLFVPEDFLRSLTGVYPAGALPVAAHELTHVLQSFADYELGKILPLAKIKGRRFITGREAGGLHQERVMQEIYFGRRRPTNPHYARALEVKLAGGTQMEVVRAFYDSYASMTELPDEKARTAARQLAADRALRLYREAGYNTQPLDYIEQGLILEELRDLPPEQINAFVIGGSSFNLQDASLLRRAGILELPDIEHSPAHDVLRVFFEQGFASQENQVQ